MVNQEGISLLRSMLSEIWQRIFWVSVSGTKIPDVVLSAVAGGKRVDYQGSGTGRPIYEVVVNGQTQRIAVTVSSNGTLLVSALKGV